MDGGRLTGKCQSLVCDLSFWLALHTPRQFSQKAQGTDYLLCAFWTAGITARPPDIGSTSCILIFQISNRTIRCILDRSGGCCEDFFLNLPIISRVTRTTLGCQLFSREV